MTSTVPTSGALSTTPAPPRPGTAADSLRMLDELPRHQPDRRPRDLAGKDPSALQLTVSRLGVLVAIVVGWEVGVRAGAIDPFFWSQPTAIWSTAVQAWSDGDMLDNTLFTFASTIGGFVIGIVGGVTIGLSFWWSRRYALTAEPLIIAFEAMPKLALAPIVVLVLGLGIGSKIAMATALVIVIQTLNTYAAVKAVDRDLVTLLYSLGATRWQVFRTVVVPSTLPWVAGSLRVAIGLALTGAIVGEYIGSTAGLGRMIQYAGSTYDIALIWVGIFTLAALSMGLYLIVAAVERRLLRGFLHSSSERR